MHFPLGTGCSYPKDKNIEKEAKIEFLNGLFFVYFRSFEGNKQYNLCNKSMWKMSIQYLVLNRLS